MQEPQIPTLQAAGDVYLMYYNPNPSCVGKELTIVGTERDEVIEGTSCPAVIHGLGGHDVIYGLGGDDVICGGDDSGIKKWSCLLIFSG